MKIKEMFSKVEGFNELAEIMGVEKAEIWFGDVLCAGVTDGESFTSYTEFRKYIRRDISKTLLTLF